MYVRNRVYMYEYATHRIDMDNSFLRWVIYNIIY